jgi:hypothetical protein
MLAFDSFLVSFFACASASLQHRLSEVLLRLRLFLLLAFLLRRRRRCALLDILGGLDLWSTFDVDLRLFNPARVGRLATLTRRTDWT